MRAGRSVQCSDAQAPEPPALQEPSSSIAMNRSVFNVFLLCSVVCVCGRMSGIYLDNGFDQTTIKKLLSKQEKREVEQEILNLLGLPTRPKPMMPVHLDKSAPKFLLDVYQSLLDTDESRLTRSEFSVSGDDQKAIDESDVIMSFSSQSKFTDWVICVLKLTAPFMPTPCLRCILKYY